MKSRLQFFDAASRAPSACGDPLEIERGSADLGWEGVILEKGYSPYFYPENVVTPYFYFALAVDHSLHWEVLQGDSFSTLDTVPGEIWVNPPWSPFTHRIDEPCFFIILAIEEERLLRAYPGELPARIEFLNNYNLTDEHLRRLIEMFYLEAQNAGRNGPTFFEQLLRLFCRYFIDNYSGNAAARSLRIGPEELGRVAAFVNENMSELISIDELACELNMSKFHFLREFKKSFGKTPYNYIMEVKLDRARDLLADSGLGLAEIAARLGFADQSHFSRHFKRRYGAAPGAYRSGRKNSPTSH